MAPGALALSKDETRLFIACANVNAVAVADVSETRSVLTGFIPTGAYPSSVRMLNDNRLAITNAHSNTVSVVTPVADATLSTMTNQAIDLVAFDPSEAAPAAPPAENAILIFLDEKSRGANFAKLAKRFSTAVNFYPSAPGSEGMAWATSGVPSDYMQLLRGRKFAANDPANQPPAGTLLTNARQAGLTVGEFGPTMPQALPPELPRYTQIRLEGPDADRALGQIVATLSRSPLWNKTAVFVVSDSQATPLVIISPYAHTSPAPNGMFYNHSSVLRTIELILKLRPMTVFDASARPLTELFSSTAQSEPYTAETP
jgi:hypothetical protein